MLFLLITKYITSFFNILLYFFNFICNTYINCHFKTYPMHLKAINIYKIVYLENNKFVIKVVEYITQNSESLSDKTRSEFTQTTNTHHSYVQFYFTLRQNWIYTAAQSKWYLCDAEKRQSRLQYYLQNNIFSATYIFMKYLSQRNLSMVICFSFWKILL